MIQIVSAVLESDLPPTARLVMIVYANYARDDGGNIYPSVANVARQTGLSERQIQRETKQLVIDGILIHEGKNTAYNGTNHYHIDLKALSEYKRGVTHSHPVTSTTKRGDTQSPNPLKNPLKESLAKANANPSSPPKEKSEKLKARNELERIFLIKTGLPAPRIITKSDIKAAQKLWWTPLQEMLDLAAGNVDIAGGRIERCVFKMRDLTYADPNGMIKTYRSIKANEIPEDQKAPQF